MYDPGMTSTLTLFLLCVAAIGVHAFEPVADPDQIDGLRREVQPVMDLSDSRLRDLIPDRSGFRFVGCPNCDGGAEENQISWEIEHPDDVFCRFCKMRFPNETYPETGIHEIVNELGETQHYPYWEAAGPAPATHHAAVAEFDPEGGYRHYFRAKGWYVAREYFSSTAWKLAQLFRLTGEMKYGHKSAIIVKRFAEVYTGYVARYDYPFKQGILFPGSQRHPYPVQDYLAAKWDYWAYGDIPTELIWAYDLTRPGDFYDTTDRRRIEDELIRASVAFTTANPRQLGNMDPHLLRGLVSAGRVIGEPVYVHDAVNWIDELLSRRFFVDGMWLEGAISYHNQTVFGIGELLQLLEGYSDPPDYRHAASGHRFDDLSLEEELPFLGKTLRIDELFRYPNGRIVALHDTWAFTQRKATERSERQLFPGVGHAWLGRGKGEAQMQVHLDFSGSYGHAHGDMLGITLFSHGAERFSDIGYTWTKQRQWASSTLAHSTVLVDGQEQSRTTDPATDGELQMFVADGDDFQLVEASGERAYPGLTSEYRRLLIVVGTPDGNAYIVDHFCVAGGDRHEFVLVGDANHAGQIDTPLHMEPFGQSLVPAGVEVTLPSGETVPGSSSDGRTFHYAYVTDVVSADVEQTYELTYRSAGPTTGAVRVHGLTNRPGQLLIGRAPSVRQAEENEGRLADHWMPISLHRRDGVDLSSRFVHLHEPYGSSPFLQQTGCLETEGDGVAIRIEGKDWVDHILIGDEGRLRAGDMTLDGGGVGFVRERLGKLEGMKIVGGQRFSLGEKAIDGQGVVTGVVRATLRRAAGDPVDGLVIDAPLPEGIEPEGLTAIVRTGDGFSHGCQVTGLRQIDGHPVLELIDDPGFVVDHRGSRQIYFPSRSWKTENRFELVTLASSM